MKWSGNTVAPINRTSACFGSRQVRSYVLHPYQMVRDLRTGVESSDPQGVLDGDIDQFLKAALIPKR